MRQPKSLFAIAGAVFALGLPAKTATADPGTIPPGQWPELSAEWWQWAYSLPLSQSPVFSDDTGEKCKFGQRGSIWFLAGVAATRTCSVPEGVSLFFPTINSVNLNAPNHCFNDASDLSKLKDLWKSVSGIIDTVRNVSVTIDGQPIKKTLLGRVKSPVFEVVLPGFQVTAGPPPTYDNLCVDLPAGIYSPTVADGYYAALPPLPAREAPYTIHLHAEASTFTEDTVYTLTVVPVKLK